MSTVILGKKVPAFTATSNQGSISLKDLAGQRVVLYFYPKDSTPGCTTEAGDFRDAYAEFQALNTQIIGISRDSIKSHDNFSLKHALPFPLMADTDESLCTLFDVIKMKNMYGKQVRGIVRSTFLLDEKGKLLKEWRAVRVPGHVNEVLESLKSII